MNLDEQLAAIGNPQNSGRDVLVDELADSSEAGVLDSDMSLTAVVRLIEVARAEALQPDRIDDGQVAVADPILHESILNFLSSLYIADSVGAQEIEAFVVADGPAFPIGSAMHVVSIIAESRLVQRRELLGVYARSDSEALRKAALGYLGTDGSPG